MDSDSVNKKFILLLGVMISPSDQEKILQRNDQDKLVLVEKDNLDDPVTLSMNANAVLGAHRNRVENFHGK